MIFHLSFPHLIPGGYVGVDVFFVLSGFLITSLLIDEWDNSGARVNLRNFYMRRGLRLLPVLGCVIVAAMAVAKIGEVGGGANARDVAHTTFDAVPWVVLYVGNLVRAFNFSTLGLLQTTWSLAVEEQFYFIWPICFVLCARRGFRRDRLAIFLAVTAVAEMAYRQIMVQAGYYHVVRYYFATDTHSDGLLLGCALGLWLSSRRMMPLRPSAVKGLQATTWLGTIVLLVIFAAANPKAPPQDITAAVLASALILVGLARDDVPFAPRRLLSSKAAVWIGRRSYGLYLWHFLIFTTAASLYHHYTHDYEGPGFGSPHLTADLVDVVAVAVAFMTAAISYRFLESPALRLKRHLSADQEPGRHRPDAPLPAERLPLG